jgi:hypothetical protein
MAAGAFTLTAGHGVSLRWDELGLRVDDEAASLTVPLNSQSIKSKSGPV